MKTKTEIKERLSVLEYERINRCNYILNESEYLERECLDNEITTFKWILN